MSESPTRRRTAPEPYKSLTWMEWTSYQLLFPKPMRGPEMQFTYTGTTIGMATPTGGAPGKWVDFFFFGCHFLVHRLLWVTIACLSFIHMCTMRQNLGEYHIKIDLSRRFFERYTKEGNFISGCLIQVPRWIDENGGLRAKVLQLLQVSHYKKKQFII